VASAALAPDPEARAHLPRAAERLRSWAYLSWYWGDAIAVDAQLAAGDRAAVVKTLERWALRAPPSLDDVLAPGRAVARLVGDGSLDPRALERVLDAVDRLPALSGVVPALEPHRPAFRFGVCVDALYHLPPALAAAGRVREDPALVRRAVRMAVEMVELLACPTGLAQWWDAGRRANNGIAWSRGMGWALLGLLDLLEELEGDAPAAVTEAAGEIVERLARAQRDDGHWATVLDHPPAGFETSTASFFVAGARHPAAGLVAPVPDEALARARAACLRALAPDGTYEGVSADVLPSWDVATYEHPAAEPSPWAQGAGVRALLALAGQVS
jgi:hypothetical protein